MKTRIKFRSRRCNFCEDIVWRDNEHIPIKGRKAWRRRNPKKPYFLYGLPVGVLLAKGNDPSLTRLGKLLRAIALDELLQVINILRGDMSFVGPKAERRELMGKFNKAVPNFSQRLMVRPGVTGVAQVYAKYDSSPVFQEIDTSSLNWNNLINKTRRMKEGDQKNRRLGREEIGRPGD